MAEKAAKRATLLQVHGECTTANKMINVARKFADGYRLTVPAEYVPKFHHDKVSLPSEWSTDFDDHMVLR